MHDIQDPVKKAEVVCILSEDSLSVVQLVVKQRFG